MGANFWIQFAITEAINLATEFIDNSKITPELKAMIESFIAAGEKLVAALKL